MTLQERVQEIRAARRHMPRDLQREIVAYVETARQQGRSVREATAALGVNEKTYSFWQRNWRATVPAKFRPVVVRATQAPIAERSNLVLELGGAARVRGIGVVELVALIRALQ
jgi:hypothetical protein